MNNQITSVILSLLLLVITVIRYRAKLLNLGTVIVTTVNRKLGRLDKLIFQADLADLAKIFTNLLQKILVDGKTRISKLRLERVRTGLEQIEIALDSLDAKD